MSLLYISIFRLNKNLTSFLDISILHSTLPYVLLNSAFVSRPRRATVDHSFLSKIECRESSYSFHDKQTQCVNKFQIFFRNSRYVFRIWFESKLHTFFNGVVQLLSFLLYQTNFLDISALIMDWTKCNPFDTVWSGD